MNFDKNQINPCGCLSAEPIVKVEKVSSRSGNYSDILAIIGWLSDCVEFMENQLRPGVLESGIEDNVRQGVERFYEEIFGEIVGGSMAGYCINVPILNEIKRWLEDLKLCSRTAMGLGAIAGLLVLFGGMSLVSLGLTAGFFAGLSAFGVVVMAFEQFFRTSNTFTEQMCYKNTRHTLYYNIVNHVEQCRLGGIEV